MYGWLDGGPGRRLTFIHDHDQPQVPHLHHGALRVPPEPVRPGHAECDPEEDLRDQSAVEELVEGPVGGIEQNEEGAEGEDRDGGGLVVG